MYTSILCVALSFLSFAQNPTPADTETDVAFTARFDGSEQRYVLWIPEGLSGPEGRDVIVALHGHGSDRWQFIQNPRDECRGLRETARAHGMIIVSPDYRAATSWMGPAAEADTLQIIEECRDRYKPGRVLLVGGSMGATSALTFAALHPEAIDGVVALNGVANHVEYTGFQDAISASFGGDKTTKPDEYRKRSAEFQPERLTMPIAFTVGGADTVTPPGSVLRLAEKLTALGRDILVIQQPQGGHETNFADTCAAIEFVIGKSNPNATGGEAKLVPAAWRPHEVSLLNGPNPIRLPATLTILSEPWNRVVAVPYIVYMPERDRLLMLVGCDYPHHAEVLYSDDRGATWTAPKRVLFDAAGNGIDGLGTSLTYLGQGRVLFLTSDRRWLSEDYGEHWAEWSVIDPTCDGKPWYTWDPVWVDRDAASGAIVRLVETGYTWQRAPEVEKDHQQGYLRFSTDLGKTWAPSIKVPQWKEVSEAALVRAADGSLVAACRTDIPPSKSGEWIDHFEGIGISISKDDGLTWPPVEKLYDYGRHHPSLLLLPDGRLLMTYVVRKGYVDTPDGFPQFGVEAILSADHGRTWDLDHRYILNAWKGNRLGENKWWASCQATSTVLLPDGALLTAFGTGYRSEPDAGGGNPSPRDAGLVLWRLSDAALESTDTVRGAPADSDTRNIFDPAGVMPKP